MSTPRTEAAVARLAELDELEVTDHAAVFDDIHEQLRDTLTRQEGAAGA